MKKKSLSKLIALLTASVFSLTYLFLIPLARINLSQAQQPDVPEPTRTQVVEKRVSKLYIPTGASSTFMKTSDGEEHLLIQDHITSTRIIESNKGTQQQEYYPYGMTSGEPTTLTDKQFTSHRSLADTGVYHAGARFYNPEMGMFVSADKVQGPNRYMYAAANPTVYTDPSGKIVPLVIAAIIIGGGAFGAGFGTGYERGSQVAQYGSVQEPARVVGAGIIGGVAGASVGYLGAVAAPAAIGAMSAGAGATSSVGLLGGAQIGVGACLSNPHCVNAVEAGAQMAARSDLPPNWSLLPQLPKNNKGQWLSWTEVPEGLPLRVPEDHIGAPDDLVTVYKGLRTYAAGRDIQPSIAKQSWLYGHKGDTNALISDIVTARLDMGEAMDQIIRDQAWEQAICPGDANCGTSWTTDFSVAAYYGQGGGVAQMTVPRSKLVSIPQLAVTKGKWPAAASALESEMYYFGIVHKEDYTMIARGWGE